MNTKLIRTPGIYLVGFMGSGKTSVGRALADELGWSFADLDDDIEADAGETITSIFESRGEPEFRRLEHEALQRRVNEVRRGQPSVVSLGGGAFVQDSNVELVTENGISLWLDCSLERLRARIGGQTHRPLARDPARFEQLFHARMAAYARADYRVEITSDDPAATVAAILALPVF